MTRSPLYPLLFPRKRFRGGSPLPTTPTVQNLLYIPLKPTLYTGSPPPTTPTVQNLLYIPLKPTLYTGSPLPTTPTVQNLLYIPLKPTLYTYFYTLKLTLYTTSDHAPGTHTHTHTRTHIHTHTHTHTQCPQRHLSSVPEG
jgi:hypothetical protein